MIIMVMTITINHKSLYQSALAIDAGPYQSPALRPDSRPIDISFCIENGLCGLAVSPK